MAGTYNIAPNTEAGHAPSFQAVPVGTILMFGSATPPTNYFMCDGSLKNRINFAALFAVISTTFGAGDGTTFALPDQRGFVLRGGTAGVTGGNDLVTLTSLQLAQHYHDYSVYPNTDSRTIAPSGTLNVCANNVPGPNTTSQIIYDASGNPNTAAQSFSVENPYVVVQFIIRYQ